MKRILREPTLHFLILAVLIFAAYSLFESQQRDVRRKIVVSPAHISQLKDRFQATWLRPPSDDELTKLIDDFVLDEAYYREALKLRLDRNDPVIRNRLRMILQMMTDDLMLVEPTDSDLAAYVSRNEKKFRLSPAYTFRQIYFNPEKHGPDAKQAIAAKIDLLQDGQPVHGDSTLLNESFQEVSELEIDRSFGQGFSEQLAGLDAGRWQGPIRSGLGWHLIRIESRTEGRIPGLDEIRQVAVREWTNEKRNANRQQINQRLLQEYDVTIDWPDDAITSGKRDKSNVLPAK